MDTPRDEPADRTLRDLDRLATPRRGIASRRDLRAAGFTTAEMDHLVAKGLLTPAQRGVYRTVGTPMSIRRRLVVACLASEELTVASHRAALWLWRLTDDEPPIEISVVDDRHPRPPSVIVHRSRDLVPAHCTVRQGVPVTKPARTLVDVGCVVPEWAFAKAVESALHRKLITVAGLRAVIDEVAGRGRNGVGVLRSFLDERALGDARPESMLEPLMARLCRDNGIADVEYQAELELEGRVLRPDFLIRAAKLVIEVDGLSVHGTRAALDSDLERQNLLVTHGYQVLRYTSTHLRTPDRLAVQILRTAARRLPPEPAGPPSEPPSERNSDR